MAEGNKEESAVNITQKNGVIRMLERYLDDLQSRQDFLETDFAKGSIDILEIKREQHKLFREKQGTEARLHAAREEAERSAHNKKTWDHVGRTTLHTKALDYVQFVSRRTEVILFAVNGEGDKTQNTSYDTTRPEDTKQFITDFISLVQEDDKFHPVPASIQILSAIVQIDNTEKNIEAWELAHVAENMLADINKTRPKTIITGRSEPNAP